MIVGLCGLARSGKDSFFSFIEDIPLNEKPNIRLAFADKLKEELDLFLRASFGISAFSKETEDKEVIRPILVAYGMQKRYVSNGLYWIEKIESEINRFQDEYNYFITDVRFPNEVLKIKDMGGICIYINRSGNLPPNEEEAKNDPLIRDMCEFEFSWNDFSETSKVENLKMVKDFAINKLKNERAAIN